MKLLDRVKNIIKPKDPIVYKDDMVFYNNRIVTDGKAGLKEHRVFYSEGKYYHKGNGKEATFKDLITVDEFNLLAQQTALTGIKTFVSGNKLNATTNEIKSIEMNINAIEDLLDVAKQDNIEKEYIELRRKIYLDLFEFEKEKVDLSPRIICDLEHEGKYKIIYLHEGETKESYTMEQPKIKPSAIHKQSKEKKPLEIVR